MTKRLAPVHPGEVLLEDFLEPMGLSQYRLAKDIHVPPRRINEIVHGTRGVSADTALRLARYLGTSERFWLNLQAQFDLDVESDRCRGSDRARDRPTRGLGAEASSSGVVTHTRIIAAPSRLTRRTTGRGLRSSALRGAEMAESRVSAHARSGSPGICAYQVETPSCPRHRTVPESSVAHPLGAS